MILVFPTKNLKAWAKLFLFRQKYTWYDSCLFITKLDINKFESMSKVIITHTRLHLIWFLSSWQCWTLTNLKAWAKLLLLTQGYTWYDSCLHDKVDINKFEIMSKVIFTHTGVHLIWFLSSWECWTLTNLKAWTKLLLLT